MVLGVELEQLAIDLQRKGLAIFAALHPLHVIGFMVLQNVPSATVDFFDIQVVVSAVEQPFCRVGTWRNFKGVLSCDLIHAVVL